MHGNRTLLRQELEKQRLELERKRDEENAQMRREMAISQQTPSMEVPSNQPNQAANQVTIEVPNNVLEVRERRGNLYTLQGNFMAILLSRMYSYCYGIQHRYKVWYVLTKSSSFTFN